MPAALSWRLLRRKESISQESPTTRKMHWQLHSERQSSVCLNTSVFSLFPCCCLLNSLRCNTNTTKGCCRSLSCFILLSYRSVVSVSLSQHKTMFLPIGITLLSFSISTPAAHSRHLSSPLLLSAQSQGSAVSTSNNPAENSFLFLSVFPRISLPAQIAY